MELLLQDHLQQDQALLKRRVSVRSYEGHVPLLRLRDNGENAWFHDQSHEKYHYHIPENWLVNDACPYSILFNVAYPININKPLCISHFIPLQSSINRAVDSH